MKKSLIAVIIAVALVGVSLGVMGVTGVFSPNSSSPSSSSSSGSSTQENSSSSSSGNELYRVERDSLQNILSSNVETANMKEVYLLLEGDTAVIQKLTSGIYIGEMAHALLGEVIAFGYYSDGNWYVGTPGEANFKKFNKVTNVIFNYQIGCGEPLAFSKTDLSIYGDKTVISFIEGQFNEKVAEGGIVESILPLLPDGIEGIINRLLEMTVQDLYNITDGDYTFVTNFIDQTDIDEIINFVFDVIELTQDAKYTQLRTALCETFNGKVKNVEINENAQVNTLINAYFDSVPANNTNNTARFYLTKLYRNVLIKDFKTATEEFEVDEIIEIVCEIALAEADEQTSEQIEKWQEYLTDIFDGKLKELKINANANLEDPIKEILSESGIENYENLASTLAKLIKESITLNEQIKENEENRSAKIAEYIANLTGYDTQDPVASKLVQEISQIYADLLGGSIDSVEQFVSNYGELTLAQIDGYLNGYLSEILGYTSESLKDEILQKTVKEIYDETQKVIDDSSLNTEEVLENIKQANGDIELIYAELKKVIEVFVEENRDKTIGEILGAESNLDSTIANVTIGEIVDLINGKQGGEAHSLKLSTLDDILLKGEVYKLLEEYSLEKALNLTLFDLTSIFRAEATDNALKILEDLPLSSVLNLIQDLTKEYSQEIQPEEN